MRITEKTSPDSRGGDRRYRGHPWSLRILIAAAAALGLAATGATPATASSASSPSAVGVASRPARNLLANPGFETLTRPSRQPVAWTPDVFVPGATMVADRSRPHSGHTSARITAPTPNDARWIQAVPVQRDTRYLLSGWIRTSRVAHSTQSEDAGASLGVMGRWDRTPAVLGTKGWTHVSLTVDSGDDTSLLIAARLGFWSGTTTGTAWFDDLSLQRVGPTPPVAHWKVLVLIYPKVDFSWTDEDGASQHVRSEITPAEQRAAATAARTFLTTDVPALSSRNMIPTGTVRVVSRTLTQLDSFNGGWWPGPGITAPELDPAFDAAIVIWQPSGTDVNTGQPRWFGAAGGLTYPRGTEQAYTSMMLDAVIHSDTRNIFRHEFGHALLYYFDAAGASPTPAVNNHSDGTDYVHCGTGTHYVWMDETLSELIPNSIYNNTSGFTHDYYSGTTALAGAPDECLGITRDAWASGSPLTHR